jgi:type VI secretion system protein ImpF
MPLENPSQAILRDLQWLLNTFSLDSVCGLELLAQCTTAVGLNFGVSSILGTERSGLNLQSLETSITQAIARFEPRLRRDSLLVTASLHDARSREVCVLIEAEYWRVDRWLPLELQTWIDRESGRFEVSNALTLESRIARHHRA